MRGRLKQPHLSAPKWTLDLNTTLQASRDDLRQGPSAEMMSARRDGQCWLHAIVGAPASRWREPKKAPIYKAVHGCPQGCAATVWCTPGWDRSVLNVTFSRRYSAAPVWDECRASLLLDPQRRRPLLMWQGHSRHPWLCPCRDRRVGRLFGSIVRGALNIRIRWRPPSAHQAAAAAGRATGAPHRYHRSAPSQCSTA